MTELTLLKPVVLANDDFDENQTYCKEFISQTSEFECAQRFTSVQHLTVSPLKEVALDSSGTSEETALKQCYTQSTCTIDCTQRSPSQENVNISTRQLIQVTPDNADTLYLALDQSTTNQDTYSSAFIHLYRDLPKDLFISRILSDFNSDEMQLKEVRSKLFTELKSFEEFPFGPGNELKRRKNTKGGENVLMKLCTDIFILTSVIDGAPFDDLKVLLSLGKHTSTNDSVCVEQGTPNPGFANNSNKSNTELSLIQNMLSSVQADIIAIKQDNKELRGEINSIKKDIKGIKTGVSEHVESTAKSINEINMSIDRVTDTSYNSASSVKNDIKQIRTELYSFNETLGVQYGQLRETLSLVQNIEKRVNKAEHKINDLRQRSVSPVIDLTNQKPMKKDKNTRNCETAIEIASESDTEADTAQRTCVQKHTETHCSKTASDIDTVSNRGTHLHRSPTTGRIQRLPNTDNHKKAPTSRTSSALFSSDKDLIGIFTNPSSNKSNSIINQGSSQKENTSSDARLSDYSTAIESGMSSSIGNNYTTDYQCTVHNQFGVLDVDTHNSVKETPISYSSALQKPSNAKQGEYSVGKQAANSIPVVISENRPKRSNSREKGPPTRDGYYNSELRALDEGDGDFETFIRRRTQRFYLGGFQANVTEETILHYTERRGIYVSWINIRRYENQNRAVIRLNVDAEHGHSLLEQGFWPRGVTCRRWYTKKQYINKTRNRRYQGHSTDTEYNNNVHVHNRYNNRYDQDWY